jgi:hypothetical protein
MSTAMRVFVAVAATGMLVVVGGCVWVGSFGDGIVVPAEMQPVIATPVQFTAATDNALQTVAPGTVIDDLSGLDGCWGAYLPGEFLAAGFVDVMHFDRAAARFTRYSGIAAAGGGLWAEFPAVAIETGRFEVTGPATVLLTTETVAYRGPHADEFPGETLPNPVARPALVTLSGGEVLFYIDTSNASEVDTDEARPIFMRFECAAAE